MTAAASKLDASSGSASRFIDPVWDLAWALHDVYVAATPDSLSELSRHLPEAVRRASVVIVVDTWRFSTTMLALVARGASRVVAVRKPPAMDAISLPVELNSDVLLGGERSGLPIPGAAFGNSPLDAARLNVGERTVVFLSSNGAQAATVAAHAGFGKILVMAVANAELTAFEAMQAIDRGGKVVFACGGFFGGAAREDIYTAGLAIASSDLPTRLSETAEEAELLYIRLGEPSRALRTLLSGDTARVLMGLGHSADLVASVTGDGFEPTMLRAMSRTLVQVSMSGNLVNLSAMGAS